MPKRSKPKAMVDGLGPVTARNLSARLRHMQDDIDAGTPVNQPDSRDAAVVGRTASKESNLKPKPHAIRKVYAGPTGPTCGVCRQPVNFVSGVLRHV